MSNFSEGINNWHAHMNDDNMISELVMICDMNMGRIDMLNDIFHGI